MFLDLLPTIIFDVLIFDDIDELIDVVIFLLEGFADYVEEVHPSVIDEIDEIVI